MAGFPNQGVTALAIANAGGLLAANNLNDVVSPATSRTSLGLGTAATQAIATFLQSANNLSELANPRTAQGNLKLPLIESLPTGISAFAQTGDRSGGGQSNLGLTLGTIYCTAIWLNAGEIVTSISHLAQTARSGWTHLWSVLTDSSLLVLKASADDISGGTWNPGIKTFALAGGAYTVPSSGWYYVGHCMAGGTTGATVTLSISTGANSAPLIMGGTANTAQTTPPALASTLTALTASNNAAVYAALS